MTLKYFVTFQSSNKISSVSQKFPQKYPPNHLYAKARIEQKN